jgi:Metallo-peptidase family M12B Reprolysin-like
MEPANASTQTRGSGSDPFKLHPTGADPLKRRKSTDAARKAFRCDTDSQGYATPDNRSPFELVVDATEGFVPLWAKDTLLRWRFRRSSLDAFDNPDAAAAAIEQLLGEAILAWGDAAPIKFTKDEDVWDFEIVVRDGDDCSDAGCVLASAFFPDAGRHQLFVYPIMFTEPREAQIATLCHEIGHTFGLRHFFAKIKETSSASELFGKQEKFTIMNYGAESKLTDDDKADLKQLYNLVWSGQLTKINGTPIRLVKPFHTVGDTPQGAVAVAINQPAA